MKGYFVVMEVTNFQLKGLCCEGCVKLIKRRLEKIEGVYSANVDLSGKTEIIADREISKSEVVKALFDTKYEVL